MFKKSILITIPLIIVLLIFGCTKEDNPVSFPDNYTITSTDMETTAEDFGALLADPNEGILQYWMQPMSGRGMHKAAVGGDDRNVSDTTFPRGDLTVSINLTFYDADSNVTEFYDSASTVRITRHLTISGTRESQMRQATINHDGFQSVTGVTPDDTVRTLNGNGSRTVDATFHAHMRDVERTLNSTHSWTDRDIMIAKDRATYPYPLSGEVDVTTSFSRDVTIGDRTRNFAVDVAFTVTFDGTRYALVTMEDGTEYWIDLEDGRGFRIHP